MAACTEDLKEASFNLFQVAEVTATAGDECATVAWASQEGKPDPIEYLVNWTADDPEISGGTKTVGPAIHELLVDGLTNDCAYTFAVQARYEDGLSMNRHRLPFRNILSRPVLQPGRPRMWLRKSRIPISSPR